MNTSSCVLCETSAEVVGFVHESGDLVTPNFWFSTVLTGMCHGKGVGGSTYIATVDGGGIEVTFDSTESVHSPSHNVLSSLWPPWLNQLNSVVIT